MVNNISVRERAAPVEAATPLTAISTTARRTSKSRRVNSALAPNAKPIKANQLLDLPDGVTVTPKGLVCSGEVSFDERKALLGRLCHLNEKGSLGWWIGDVWNTFGYGEHKGLEAFLGRSYGTAANYASVAATFEFPQRREKLSITHHQLVRKFEPEEQERFLDIAEKEGLSTRDLEKEIAAARSAAHLQRMDALDPNFINEENARNYVDQLINAPRIPLWQDMVRPWESTDVGDCLKRNPFARSALIRNLEADISDRSKLLEFARQTETEMPEVEFQEAAE